MAYSQYLMRARKTTLMRPVEFGEAVPAGTRLTLFSADKPDRHFTVVTFLMDKVSGIMLDLRTGVPCYQVEDEEGRIYCFSCRSERKMKTAGAFGDRIRSILMPGLFLMGH